MELCTYCGAAGFTERDHVVPHSWNHVPGRKRTFREDEVVPACPECNRTLSDRYLFTIEARAAYLLGAYEKKYKKLLNWIDNWTEEEIAELGYSLQISVQKTRGDAEEVHRRLAYLRCVANRIPQDSKLETADAQHILPMAEIAKLCEPAAWEAIDAFPDYYPKQASLGSSETFHPERIETA